MRKKILAMISGLCLLANFASAAEIAAKVGEFTLKDIRYLPRTLADFGDKDAFAFVFWGSECGGFDENLDLLRALDAAYFGKNVQFVLVNVGAKDSIMDAALFAMEKGIDFPVVKDVEGDCAKALGVAHIPCAVVLDKGHGIIYRGKIAEKGELGAGAEGDSLLKGAIDAALSGMALSEAETPVNGLPLPSFEVPTLPYEVNYAEHIAPILQKHCEACHRPNGIGPFSLSNYNKASANAEMLAEVVQEGRMPPYYAHPAYGTFENDARLTGEEKLRVVNWVRGGMAEGNPALLPPPVEYADTKWLTNPDLIIPAKQQVALPATGFLPYQYLSFDHVFEKDTYVQAIEIMPENPRVVHHANAFFTDGAFGVNEDLNFLTGKVPGSQPSETKHGIAWLIPAGSVLRIQAHYVTTGKPEKDRISIGLRFAKEPINKRLYYKAMVDHNKINIPPGERAWHMSDTAVMEEDGTGIGVFGHLHLRGKHFKIDAAYPDGKTETLFAMPNYNFGWQMTYHYPYPEVKFPKGTRIESTAWYDNSAFNPYNPDSSVTVIAGPQSHDEMLNGFFVYTRDDENLGLNIDPNTGFVLDNLAARN